ncbi:MAG: DNA topoisomerase IB [Janthinobacterium lividum]
MKARSVPSQKKNKQAVAAELPASITDPAAVARSAGLRYVNDRQPGIRREKKGDRVRFVGPEGKPVRDAETLARIKALVIPPAWSDVWITTHAKGHLQCTGRDVRGRKQSRYHPHWREVRDDTKYERMARFASALPLIRKRVEHDLAMHGLPRQKVLATVVRLMEETHIRVGNEEYARENKSYGLTTMLHKHVEVNGSKITFDFQGKSRVHHTINLQDRRLAKILKQVSDLPGQELFQFVDDAGHRHHIDSSDVNDYLRETTGEHFTAKDFRTWAGSVLCCDLLSAFEPATTLTQAKKNVVEAIARVAAQLGNTPSVCRKCYVHPAVLETYMGRISPAEAKHALDQEIAHEREEIATQVAVLRREEQALMNLLQQKSLLEKAA